MTSVAEEAGATIRAAIKDWPQTLRLISLLVAATGPVALVLITVVVLRY
jgi:hypothetical protein